MRRLRSWEEKGTACGIITRRLTCTIHVSFFLRFFFFSQSVGLSITARIQSPDQSFARLTATRWPTCHKIEFDLNQQTSVLSPSLSLASLSDIFHILSLFHILFHHLSFISSFSSCRFASSRCIRGFGPTRFLINRD